MKEQLPTKIRAICIVAIIFAAFGVLSALTGLAGSAIPQPKIPYVPGHNDKTFEAQREMQLGIQDLTNRYQTVQIAMLVLVAIVSIAMLISGIMALRNDEGGLKALRVTCWAAIPVDLARGAFTIFLTSKMSAVMTRYVQQIMEATSRGHAPTPGLDGFMSGIMSLGMQFGLGVSATWILCKVGFYIYSAITLKKPRLGSVLPPPLPVQQL